MVESTVTILGKRKTRRENEILVLSAPSQPSVTSDTIILPPGPSTSTEVPTKKRHRCTYQGCEKAYSKPSRLEEHERSHTGQVYLSCHSLCTLTCYILETLRLQNLWKVVFTRHPPSRSRSVTPSERNEAIYL